jgi:hypothetical protein
MCLSPYFSTPIGLHFLRFLKHIFGYTALHYTVDRLNLHTTSQSPTCFNLALIPIIQIY